MSYAVTPQAYLERAKSRLISGEAEDLFYAAFELRCCVETRQRDYLDAIEWYEGKKIKMWRLGEIGRKLHELWRHPKIAKLTYDFDGRRYLTFYTPITPKLTRAGDKELGALLHAQAKVRTPDDQWWESTRNKLMDIYREAWVACRGEHIAPPLLDPGTGKVHPFRIYASPETADLVLRLLRASGGGRFKLEVDYLDDPPAEWACDI